MSDAAQIKTVDTRRGVVTVSVVSHGHGKMVDELVRDLLTFEEVSCIIVTLNLPESLSVPEGERVVVINNAQPKGFGANHNQAFLQCCTPFFCPLNPDITFTSNPFLPMLSCHKAQPAELLVPLIVSLDGVREDSLRYFPSPLSLLKKALWGDKGVYCDTLYKEPAFCPDWAAGMFMLFESSAYRKLNGFDETFYLYYEDVDICARLWKQEHTITACCNVEVVHDARRESHRSLTFLKWHLASLFRYFFKHAGRLPKVNPNMK